MTNFVQFLLEHHVVLLQNVDLIFVKKLAGFVVFTVTFYYMTVIVSC